MTSEPTNEELARELEACVDPSDPRTDNRLFRLAATRLRSSVPGEVVEGLDWVSAVAECREKFEQHSSWKYAAHTPLENDAIAIAAGLLCKRSGDLKVLLEFARGVRMSPIWRAFNDDTRERIDALLTRYTQHQEGVKDD